MAVAYSSDHVDCPTKKKVVRAELFIGGWIMEPHPEDKNKTNSCYLIQVDAKGYIPKMVINATSKTQGFIPLRLNEAMHKHFKRQ